jgi:hypothetical protein
LTDKGYAVCCRPAVERAFTELSALGVPQGHAVEAALIVYRFHHPEIPVHAAVADVTRWTIGRTLH